MNHSRNFVLTGVFAAIVLGLGFCGYHQLVGAQEPLLPGQSRDTTSTVTDEARYGDVPKSALLTERGRQLAEELGHLQRSKATLGEKHPSRPAIENQIDAIRRELTAWSSVPAGGAVGGQDIVALGDEVTPLMNEVDLRQLVLRLSERVARLEQKVIILERSQR
ncbi:hypothetical protein [Rubripirellula reticaptiva]|nr:hypothetical protein [Rubripirellula reticaptiva]